MARRQQSNGWWSSRRVFVILILGIFSGLIAASYFSVYFTKPTISTYIGFWMSLDKVLYWIFSEPQITAFTWAGIIILCLLYIGAGFLIFERIYSALKKYISQLRG